METFSKSISVSNLDHLGLVAGMIDSIGLVEEIDRLIPSERKVSHGIMIKALIINAMGFSQHALYITPKFFERCPVKHLLGAGYEACDFNDDSIGRCLDALFEYGLNKLFVQLAHKACREEGIDTTYWHVDSTNFSVEGEYADEEGGAVKVRRGFAKDKRTDLKQVTLGLITSYKTAIPRYMQSFDGNASDKQTLATMIDKFAACFEAGEDLGIFISDSGAYSAENIAGPMSKTGWIARVPETIGEAKEWIEKTQDVDLQEFANIAGYRFRAVPSMYGGVEQRWLVTESGPLADAAAKTVAAKAQGQIDGAKAKMGKKAAQWFRELSELEAFVARLEQTHPLVRIEYTLKERFYYCRPGRPRQENRRVEYALDTFAVAANDAAIASSVTQKSRFVLATNVLDDLKLPDEQVLAAYKTQATSVENGFKFLKDPIFFAESFFVKKTSRLEGLLMIMTLSLLVYSLCERNLRNALAEKNESVDTQTSKTTQKPTIRLVFNQFRGIHLVKLNELEPAFCANLNDNHKKIIRALGHNFAKYYFLRI
jgi:transposase